MYITVYNKISNLEIPQDFIKTFINGIDEFRSIMVFIKITFILPFPKDTKKWDKNNGS